MECPKNGNRKARYIVPLLQSGTDFDVFVGETGEDGAAFGADGGGDDHAVGFDAAEFARREIHDDRDFAADQFLGFVELRDAGANLADLGANVHGEFQQFISAYDTLGGLDLPDAHFDFGKILDANFLRGGGRGGSSSATRDGRACRRGSRDRRGLLLRFVFHGFHPLNGFRFFNARKKCLRFAQRRARVELTPAECVQFVRTKVARLSKQRPNLCGAFRQDGMRQRVRNTKHFSSDPENCAAPLIVRIGATQHPWLLGSEIFVRGGDQRPDQFERTGKSKLVVKLQNFADRGLRLFRERFVLRLQRPRLRNFPATILLDHRRGAAGKVAEAVGEVAVVARNEGIVAEVAILAENRLSQKIVAKRVHPEDVHDGTRANDIANRLAHFGAVHEKPAMRPNLLRQRQTRSHQKRRPVDGMKSNNLFADEMDIGGPETLFLIIRAANGAQIRRQRVKPNVKNVRLFARNGNAPANRGARNAKIPETAFHKTDNFVAARFRLNEIRMLGVPVQQRFLKSRKFEKIIWLRDSFRGPAAIGTVFTRLHVHVGIVVDAVLPRVVSWVDETIFAAQLEEPLHRVRMFQVGGANKLVALNA